MLHFSYFFNLNIYRIDVGVIFTESITFLDLNGESNPLFIAYLFKTLEIQIKFDLLKLYV